MKESDRKKLRSAPQTNIFIVKVHYYLD